MTAPTKKKKLCWNCEGSVSFQEENCPYCGVYLSPSEDEAPEEEMNDLFSPPYQVDETSENSDEVPSSPYAMHEEPHEREEEEPIESERVTDEIRSTADEVKRVLVPLSMLLSGTVFFLFGLALFLFSRHGVFVLQWNGAYWYFYLGVGLAALLFGWKSLNQVEEIE